VISVGLDLSLTSTGVVIIDNAGPILDIRTHRIRTAGKEDAPLADRQRRLMRIQTEINELFPWDGEQTGLVVIEGPSFGQARQRGTFDRAGLWWLVVDMYLSSPLPGNQLAEVAPSARSRYATGKGNAAKDQVLAATIRRYPQVDVDGNDIADALLLAAMGARQLGWPIEDRLPVAMAAAMSAVRWPS
jgi:crossover junction endodeoxyribonuclease RuvC